MCHNILLFIYTCVSALYMKRYAIIIHGGENKCECTHATCKGKMKIAITLHKPFQSE